MNCNDEKRIAILNNIYDLYVEYQRVNDEEAGYATYRCVSAARIAKRIMKSYKNMNSDLKDDVTEQTLTKICEKLLAEECKAEDGWVKINKNGETAYYHPKHVRTSSFDFYAGSIPFKYDPMCKVTEVLEKLRAETNLFKPGVNFNTNKTIFGYRWYNGNAVSNCCFSHRVYF